MTRFISFFVLLLSASACSGPSETASNESLDTATAADTSENAQKTAENVVRGYLAVKDALVASDANTAQNEVVNLLEVIDATDMPAVQQKAKEMAASEDLAMLRTHFDSLSVALYEEVKQQPDNGQTLYKQYCPMAFDNRGAYWLSRNQEIRNPYFGDEMLKCGRTEEEINF